MCCCCLWQLSLLQCTEGTPFLCHSSIFSQVTSRGGMGVPQFLKENVQSPLFVPLPSFMGEYDWSTIPHAAQPNLPPIEDHAVCCVAADYAPSSPKRSRKGDIKTYKKQKVHAVVLHEGGQGRCSPGYWQPPPPPVRM